MESRAFKYMDTINEVSGACTRTSRNSRLYREVYGKYGELDNLPIQDNTDEIDMEKLREMVNPKASGNTKGFVNDIVFERNVIKNDDQKVYDINKLLERAKYENNKLKEPLKRKTEINRNILQTLENNELSLDEIKKACQKYEVNKVSDDGNICENELFVTREMKYHTKQISVDPLIEQVISDSELSLDLFEDLKPTGNTVITKPIVEEEYSFKDEIKNNKIEENFHSDDISDIDVIKNTVKQSENIDNDFYTSSYKFSENDFNDEEFFYEKSTNNVFKIFLLVVLIIVFVFVIYYFVANYGLGI